MAKKIRLIDEVDESKSDSESTSDTSQNVDMEKLMQLAEAIDWKLWEMLKLMKKFDEEK